MVQQEKSERKQTILTSEAAIEIFNLRPALKTPIGDAANQLRSSTVAKVFGVSPKTVRDIWVGRTWYRQTLPLDPERLNTSERLSKQMGRPKGSKDKSLRSRRQRVQTEEQGLNPGSSLHLPNPVVQPTASPIQQRELSTIDAAIASFYPDACMRSAMLHADFALARGQAHTSDAFVPGGYFPQRHDPFHNDWGYWPKQAGDP